ncbi:MAG: DUF378 domain-containing protein, partial [Clostridia bacterium]
MLKFFAFIFMWLGSLNWFFISAFQYDFVAGFFGTQSSLFSRVIYFVIGMAGFVMFFEAIKSRGKINLIQRPIKRILPTPKKVSEEKPTEDFDDFVEARAYYEKSLSLDPNNLTALVDLGNV